MERLSFNYKMMWQGNILYLFGEAFDDTINTSHTYSYMNDGFEVFIDGNNDKSSSTDGNDARYTLVYSTTPASDQVFLQRDSKNHIPRRC